MHFIIHVLNLVGKYFWCSPTPKCHLPICPVLYPNLDNLEARVRWEGSSPPKDSGIKTPGHIPVVTGYLPKFPTHFDSDSLSRIHLFMSGMQAWSFWLVNPRVLDHAALLPCCARGKNRYIHRTKDQVSFAMQQLIWAGFCCSSLAIPTNAGQVCHWLTM